MPAARISFSLELSSATTYLSISAGVISIGLIASCLNLCCIVGVASTFVAAAWNFSTIARYSIPDGQTRVRIAGIERGRFFQRTEFESLRTVPAKPRFSVLGRSPKPSNGRTVLTTVG